MRKISKMFCAFAAGSLLVTACIGNFEDLNTHPTDLYPDMMTPTERIGTLFPPIISLLCRDQENANQYQDQIIYGQLGGYFTCPTVWSNTNIGTYNPSDQFVQSPFNDIIPTFYSNYFNILAVTGETGYIPAWLTVLRVGAMIRVADCYGPIPYSKMGQGDFEVAYDGLDELYPRMIQDLTEAISALQTYVATSTGTSSLAQYDIMYGGDFSKWIKFANSLKFRMAVRIAHVAPEVAKQAMQEAMEGGMILENSDNALLPTNDNPYRKASADWGDLTINATLSTYMNGYNDPRRDAYMLKATTGDQPYNGVQLGIQGKGKVSDNSYSKPAYTSSDPMAVFYAAESYFLMAEAAVRGWISGGAEAARNYYETGISRSMAQWGVQIGNYITEQGGNFTYTDPSGGSANINNAPAVTWADNDDDRIAQILTQKYLANYPIGLESWSDFRRTGWPKFIGARNNMSSDSYIGHIDNDRMIRRLPYPQSEYSSNPTNVNNAVSTWFGGQDLGNLDLWWAQKSGGTY